MQIAKKLGCLIVLTGLLFPLSQAAAAQKTFTGIVTRIVGSQVYIKASTAMTYRAEIGSAQLVRKNGSPMQFTEIILGDKIEIRGTLWGDASISADYVRNMSLYTHISTFTGKISSINPQNSTFTIYSKQNGEQTITTDTFTTYKKNGKSAVFKDLQIYYTVSVQGIWDRSNTIILAKEISATYRMVGISIGGTVVAKTDSGITVASSGILYGINTAKAKLQSKNSKTISLGEINPGDSVKVQGKHISESSNMEAETVKDLSISK